MTSYEDETRDVKVVLKEKKLEMLEDELEKTLKGRDYNGGFEEKENSNRKFKETEISKAFSHDVRLGVSMGEVKYSEKGLKNMEKL